MCMNNISRMFMTKFPQPTPIYSGTANKKRVDKVKQGPQGLETSVSTKTNQGETMTGLGSEKSRPADEP